MGNGIPTLDPEQHSLDTLRTHLFKLHGRLLSEEPHTTPLIGPVAKLLVKVDTGIAKQQSLGDAVVVGRARAVSADRGLNHAMESVSVEIHGGRKVDVDDPKHQDYFEGPVPVWEAKLPTLGAQLTLMEKWPGKLKQDSSTRMQALLQPVSDAVALGVQRRDELKAGEDAQSNFSLYEKRDLFAEYNSLAATTHADLVTFAQNHPELRLPSDWATSCFVHESRDPGPQTVAEVDKLLEKERAVISALEAKRAEFVQRDADAAKAASDAAVAQSQADAAKVAEDTAKQNRQEAQRKADEAKKKAKKTKKR